MVARQRIAVLGWAPRDNSGNSRYNVDVCFGIRARQPMASTPMTLVAPIDERPP